MFNRMSPVKVFPTLSFPDPRLEPIFQNSEIKARPLKWSEARRMALQRDRVCRICNSDMQLTVHHMWPRGLGGGHEIENLVTLCEPCHHTFVPPVPGLNQTESPDGSSRISSGSRENNRIIHPGFRKLTRIREACQEFFLRNQYPLRAISPGNYFFSGNWLNLRRPFRRGAKGRLAGTS